MSRILAPTNNTSEPVKLSLGDVNDRVPTATDENLEYRTFHDVVTEVRDTCIIDLARYVNRLPVEYSSALLPEPPGVYVYGGLNPIAHFSPRAPLYSMSQYRNNPNCPDIRNFKDFISCKEDVVNGSKGLVAHCPYINRHHFRETCTFNYSAVYLAAITVWDMLNELHRETRPVTNVGLHTLEERNYLLPDVSHASFRIDAQPGIRDLLTEVSNFIGRDICHVYSLRMQNTSLFLDKGNDYRVIEYYRQLFESIEDRIATDYGY